MDEQGALATNRAKAGKATLVAMPVDATALLWAMVNEARAIVDEFVDTVGRTCLEAALWLSTAELPAPKADELRGHLAALVAMAHTDR